MAREAGLSVLDSDETETDKFEVVAAEFEE